MDLSTTTVFVTILQFVIPALVVFLVTYLTLQKYLDEDLKRRKLELQEKKSEAIIPVKIQAYERVTILLERLKPDHLVLRLVHSNMNATQYKQVLLEAVSDEFNHNVSQQIYISDQAWTLIKAVKENTLNIIGSCYKDMTESSKATDLGKAILKEVMNRNDNSAQVAINFLKKEIDLVF